MERKVFYGQFHYALVVQIPKIETKTLNIAAKDYILACVSPCNTNTIDGAVKLAHYKDKDVDPQEFIDVQSIECLVGRVLTRGHWWIIDRSKGVARTDFMDGNQDSDDE